MWRKYLFWKLYALLLQVMVKLTNFFRRIRQWRRTELTTMAMAAAKYLGLSGQISGLFPSNDVWMNRGTLQIKMSRCVLLFVWIFLFLQMNEAFRCVIICCLPETECLLKMQNLLFYFQWPLHRTVERTSEAFSWRPPQQTTRPVVSARFVLLIRPMRRKW